MSTMLSKAAATDISAEVSAARPTVMRTVLAMTARDVRVIRRTLVMNALRIVLQPLLFVFVFAYVMPKIGATGGSGFGASSGNALSTVMVPGLVGSTMIMQSMAAVIFPLVMELSGPGSIEDRALAPVPIPVIGLQKIIAAVIEGVLAGLLVFPIVLLVHADGQQPSVHVDNWPLLAVVMLAGALLASALGMYLGTVIDPRHIQVLFTLVMFPAMMLGCVYFPWTALADIRWLQIAVLANPMVYMNEGLRAVLTPQIDSMATWAYLLALVAGSLLFTWLAIRSFTRRVTK